MILGRAFNETLAGHVRDGAADADAARVNVYVLHPQGSGLAKPQPTITEHEDQGPEST